jgi:hypothetical protein
MLTVDHYAHIRQPRRDGLTIRQIADQLHHSPKSILKALTHPEPAAAVSSGPRAVPVFGPFRHLVDAILGADEAAPRKQRHTAPKTFRRLRDEHGYPGGYERVRLSLLAQDRAGSETFIPLAMSRGSAWRPTSATSRSRSPTAGDRRSNGGSPAKLVLTALPPIARPHRTFYPACRTRVRSNSHPARPYIAPLMGFSRFT